MGSVGLGRPSSFDPAYVTQIAEMAEAGATDVEIAEAIGVSRMTLWRWKQCQPLLCDILKSSKEVADSRVEHSLYSKALNGDTTACIFWLKNRKPEQWRDSQMGGSSITLTVSGPLAERLLNQSTLQSINPPTTLDAQLDDNTGDKL